jgi:hypothetical protein
MSESFDAPSAARSLINKVKLAIDKNSVRDRLDVELTLGLMSESQRKQVASEMEKKFSWRLGTNPYVSVIRGSQGNVVAINFYPGWLDIDNYGQKLLVATYSINL